MYCWACGEIVEVGFLKKIGFRAVCDKCDVYLHCCQGCRFFQKGLANDCKIPGTERVADRSASNFCEDFSLLEKRLEVKDKTPSKSFEDLFK